MMKLFSNTSRKSNRLPNGNNSRGFFRRFYKESVLLAQIICLFYVAIFLLGVFVERNNGTDKQAEHTNLSLNMPVIAQASAEQLTETQSMDFAEEPSFQTSTPRSNINENHSYTVQAVLGAKRQVVLASGIDAKITKLDLESGDRFKKGKVLIEYDCTVDYGRLNEVLSRQRVTEKQLDAYKQLVDMDSASKIELLMAQENNEQNKALITQIKGRLQSCKHVAPWDGRVTRKMANKYEYVQTGRVLMEISSIEPLRAEFLIPSEWLRWLNVGTPLKIRINETSNSYIAKIVSIHGEVDPVSQSIQVVAEMEKYHEELLPGMSGQAIFSKQTVENGEEEGFLGIKLIPDDSKGTP